MKMKTATIIAVIGSITGLVASIFSFTSNIIVYGVGLGISYYIATLLALLTEISLIVFFITLYKNQK